MPMTIEALNAFANALRTDPEIARGLSAAVEQNQAGDAAQGFAAYAREHGFAVTREDVAALQAAARNEEGALSDEQLETVSGGAHPLDGVDVDVKPILDSLRQIGGFYVGLARTLFI
jgi:predicted ribosomally synthesized peptide with nif11-like leader